MKRFLIVFLSILFFSNDVSWAASCPAELLAASKKIHLRGLWVHDVSPEKGWMPLDSTRPLSANSTDEFAFIGRTTLNVSDSEGAISVKFLSKSVNAQSPAENVLLRRTGIEAGCGYRKYFLWALAHLDFLIGVNVDVKDYIRFHATDSDGDGYIKRFHAAYRDQAGDRTDSAAGDKRSAFLINHHEPPLKSTEALIAGIKLFFQSKAEAETSTKSSAPRVPGVVKAQLTKFEQYSEAETQVHTYELNGGPACVRFSEREQRKATDTKSTDIEVVDLDAPKGSEFRRRNVRIDWR